MDKDITFSSCNVEIVRKEEHTENTEIAKEEYGVNIFNRYTKKQYNIEYYLYYL